MTDTARHIAELVDRLCGDIPRVEATERHDVSVPGVWVADLARRFFADAQFEALNLARVFGTTDTRVFQAGLALMSPPFAPADAEVVFDALALAAAAQARRNRVVAGAGLGLAFLGVGKLISTATKTAA